MKTKRSRKDYSEDDSDEPEQHWAASKRKSDSDLFASSDEGPKKSKKRRKKRDTSSESESEDTDKESHKKRKHKKKKRKHSKKKRKDVSSEDSDSDSEDGSSDATEEDSPVIVKKRHKHRHRHSGKHSKKRRQESDDAYAEKVSVSSEREVAVKVAPSHKMRSVCMSGREQRRPTSVEKISSEEEPPRNRIERREHPRNIVYGRDDNREIAENSRNKHPPSRNPPVQYLKKGEEQAAYYPARAEAGGSRPPPRFPDHPRHPEQGREQRPRDGRERNEREDRPREEREYQNKYQDNSYNRYGDGNKNYERNGANKFQKDKYEEPRNNERYAGQSNQNYRDNRPPGGERYDERPQGYNNRRGSNSYSQNYPRDNQRQDESYEKNNDYHNNRNEQRGNRFQERNDYSAGNTSRRYESRDVNERTNPVKRERSSSPNRGALEAVRTIKDVKQERRPDSRRVSKERSSRNDFKREEREESGTRTRERFPRHRASPAATDEGTYEWGRKGADGDKPKPAADKDKPNFGLSGKLTEDTNTVNGVVLKYSEPPEARQPKRKWRFYPFKGDKALPILYIHRQSCFLLGRDRKVSDIPLDHPSVSKQHAALQYRLVPFTREDGSRGKRVRPYIIDLGSANGTFVNNNKVDPSKFVELLERDVVKFGFSQREYVLLHENSKDDAMDDDDVRLGHSDDGKGRVKDEHSN